MLLPNTGSNRQFEIVLLAMSKQFDYVNNVVDDDTELDITPLVEPVATCLIVIGIVLFVIAFLGFCGACCDSRLLLALVSLSQFYYVT